MVLDYHYDNLAKHNVTPEEVDECLDDSDRIVLRKGKSLVYVGQTYSGRLLEVCMNENEFVYHAQDASKFCYTHYKKKKKK